LFSTCQLFPRGGGQLITATVNCFPHARRKVRHSITKHVKYFPQGQDWPRPRPSKVKVVGHQLGAKPHRVLLVLLYSPQLQSWGQILKRHFANRADIIIEKPFIYCIYSLFSPWGEIAPCKTQLNQSKWGLNDENISGFFLTISTQLPQCLCVRLNSQVS
jgi:hypothetical protein